MIVLSTLTVLVGEAIGVPHSLSSPLPPPLPPPFSDLVTETDGGSDWVSADVAPSSLVDSRVLTGEVDVSSPLVDAAAVDVDSIPLSLSLLSSLIGSLDFFSSECSRIASLQLKSLCGGCIPAAGVNLRAFRRKDAPPLTLFLARLVSDDASPLVRSLSG